MDATHEFAGESRATHAPPFELTADWYDAIYRAKAKDYAAEARAVRQIAAEHGHEPGADLLDVGCGTGEHLRFLSCSFCTAGVDRSEAMLAVARRKLPDVPLFKADMRTFELSGTFDVIVSLFASVGYLETRVEIERAYERLAAHLSPGGIVLVEPALSASALDPPQATVTHADVGGMVCERRSTARHVGNAIEIEFSYRTGRSTTDERHRIRLHDAKECVEIWRELGFQVEHRHVSPFDAPLCLITRPAPPEGDGAHPSTSDVDAGGLDV